MLRSGRRFASRNFVLRAQPERAAARAAGHHRRKESRRARSRPQSRANGSSAKRFARASASLGPYDVTIQLRSDLRGELNERVRAELGEAAGVTRARTQSRPNRSPTGSSHGIATAHTFLRFLVFAVHAVRCMAARPAAGAGARAGSAATGAEGRERAAAARARSSFRRRAGSAGRSQAPAAGLAAGPTVSVETDVFHAEISTRRRSAPARVEAASRRRGQEEELRAVPAAAGPLYVAQSGLLGGEPADAPHAVHRRGHRNTSSPTARTTLEVRLEAPPVNGVKRDEGLSLPARQLSDRRVVRDRRTRAPRRSSRTPTSSSCATTSRRRAIRRCCRRSPASASTPTRRNSRRSRSRTSRRTRRATSKTSDDGWIAMVQHYFLAAWLPKNGTPREFYTRKVDEPLCRRRDRARRPRSQPGATATLERAALRRAAGAGQARQARARASISRSTTAGSRSSRCRCSGCCRGSTSGSATGASRSSS